MKLWRGPAQRLQLDGSRQTALQGETQFGRAMRPRRIKMEHLRQGVHPGVRPSTALEMNLLSTHFSQLPLNQILNRVPALLALPAMESRAIIGTDAFPAW